ncbi:MAG: rod shape-determining protein RodA [Legionella sp.]|nr:MAG: rod shape-determining protein RodA [Legionella sp.]
MNEVVRNKPFAAVLESWPLLAIGVAISLLGILTMDPFGAGASFAEHQLMSLTVGVGLYIVFATADMHFIRRTPIIITAYLGTLVLLASLLVFAPTVMGAKSWFTVGPFSLQPADPAKLVFIAIIAKYFSRRHTQIGQFWHVIVSGAYAGAMILLVLVQPDLGTAAILSAVWFGLILVSGIPLRHLIAVFFAGLTLASGLWFFGLREYQRDRILSFVNPAADPMGAGYNAYQAVVATGSGELLGKGIGYGTQSKLRFLPEYQSDFIFASFAEEWGFVGIVLVLALYALLFFLLIRIAQRAATNFDSLFTIGVTILLMAHMLVHVGINLGIFPVTGTTTPFMSYGGSHLVVEFIGLGIVASLARYGRSVPRSAADQEYLGG